MANFEKTQIDSSGIASILKDKMLSVPAYQRSYSWEKQNVSQFLTDIISGCLKNESEYFLGTVVLVQQQDNQLEIVDGQQRLATTALFIAVLRDYLQKNGDDSRTSLINNYLFSKDIITLQNTFHLTLNSIDNPFFEAFIFNTNKKADLHDPKSARLMFDAIRVAYDHINALKKNDPRIIETLLRILKYIEHNVIVVSITVSDTANAFAIFETLNDRGLDLSIADLLKNYLFGLSGDKVEEAKALWIQIISTLAVIGDESLLPKFIYYYWLSVHGQITQNSLFGAIKKQYQTKPDSITFLTQLADAARHFVAMQNSQDSRWKTETCRVAIRDIKRIPLEQIQPILLAIVANFSDNELQKTLKKMVAWTVRFHVAANTRTSQFREKLSAISQRIHKHEITTEKALHQELSKEKLLPSNSDFEREFAQISPTHLLARYYLSELERVNRLTKGKQSGLKPDPSPDEVDLEHILPRTISNFTDWPDFNEETASQFVGRLGNLTIMPRSRNSKIGNNSFDEKKKEYANSEFMVTSELDAVDAWNTTSIESRQNALAKLATKAWPLQ